MCFDLDSQPPALPDDLITNFATSKSEEVVLTSGDNTEFAAYISRPAEQSATGIVILPDVRGLYQFYKDLADRFAEAGYNAIAIDYFGRTAGLTPRDEQFDYWPFVQQTKAEQVTMDVSTAIAYLKDLPDTRINTLFTVGFCFGGTHSFKQAAQHHGLKGVIGFYGHPTRQGFDGSESPISMVKEFECPVLGLFGGADQNIPAEEVQKFDQALISENINREIITYPGAPHSFFDRKQEEFQSEAADSWRRILSFITAYS